MTNRAETTVGDGVQINQNTTWRASTTDQIVSVVAHTYIQLIGAVGSLLGANLLPVGDKPPPAKGAAGGGLLVLLLENRTQATIGASSVI